MPRVPRTRIRKGNDRPINSSADYILYWMIACRRTKWNFALQRAIERAVELKKPLVVLEALRVGYKWACKRFHRFILDGMVDNARSFAVAKTLYYPYVEPEPDADKGLLAELAQKACLLVTDDFPAFFIPRMISSVSQQIPVYMEIVDSNGLLPINTADREFTTAYSFRRFLQKALVPNLSEKPMADPLKKLALSGTAILPREVQKKWPPASLSLLEGNRKSLAHLPIDHSVETVELRGGPGQAENIMHSFVKNRLSAYPENRNHPDEQGTSGLSPYLHFGHISPHQIFFEIAAREEWSMDDPAPKATGSRTGWWGMSEPAEAFLDELITWRELGFNMCSRRQDYDRYETLPDWALDTLARHETDSRAYHYTINQLESSETHDPLWNSTQRQLVLEGTIHNYLRMLWGKKILEWSSSPREALKILIQLNNKYALDGRDPNSYSGIFWVLGRYDRAWGPERPVFGKVRYMSSKNTMRKIRVKEYIQKYST